jgi:hypothetical protein
VRKTSILGGITLTIPKEKLPELDPCHVTVVRETATHVTVKGVDAVGLGNVIEVALRGRYDVARTERGEAITVDAYCD